MTRIKEALYTYFKGLETGNITMILEVFADNAIVHSPLYGDMPAAIFYSKFFADTRTSDISLLNFFSGADNTCTAAVHFKYHWVLKDGTPAHFECVDVFKFDGAGKIADINIIYDTAQLRDAFENLT